MIENTTRGDDPLDVYLVLTESSVTSIGILQGISDHLAVILKVEREDTCTEPQVERVVPVYNKTEVSGLQSLLRDKFREWASNGSKVEEIWNKLKNCCI